MQVGRQQRFFCAFGYAMSLIQAESVSLSFGPRKLFANLSFTISEDDRIALVGDNGSGKSSLIKALLGQVEIDGGRVIMRRGLRIGYMPQEVPPAILDKTPYNALLDMLPADERSHSSWKADVALADIGLPAAHWHRSVKEL